MEKKWVSGLDAPKGLAVSKDFLYVSDVNKIWKISIKNKSKELFMIKDAGFLNDLVAHKDGTIFAQICLKIGFIG